MNSPLRLSLLSALLALGAPMAHAQNVTPRDVPYPGGALSLTVDLSRAPLDIYQVKETIPVQPGTLALYYPRWVPGNHMPSNPIQDLSGLVITAQGKQVPWHRDLRDMYLIRVDVPAGVSTLELSFQLLVSSDSHGFMAATPKLADLEFNQVLFYPAGYYTQQIPIQPSVTLPDGWQFASALEVSQRTGHTVAFKPVNLTTLVDSPLIAGAYFKQVDLAPHAAVPVHLDMAADEPGKLTLTDKQIAQYGALVSQAEKLFASHHYAHYDFLLTLSEHVGASGREHHQSSDNHLPGDGLDEGNAVIFGDLLPHEYVHSWNGKFRRPTDLWTPDLNVPMQDDLLWVYEGLTEYYGKVLAARSGIWSASQYRDVLARAAADVSFRSGRQWRTLQDTADATPMYAQVSARWDNWQRGSDYYPEGALLWLDVDTQIRDLSQGKRSLDDFARAFFGMDSGSYAVRTYGFGDLVDTLNQVQPYDWARFLRERLDYTGDQLPEHGIERGGWKLVFDDTRSEVDKVWAGKAGGGDLMYGAGFNVGGSGRIGDVRWGSAAFAAGLVPGLKLVAVNDQQFTIQVLKDAISAAKNTHAPIKLLVQNNEYFNTIDLDYHDGLKYPHLVRAPGSPDLIDAISAPRK